MADTHLNRAIAIATAVAAGAALSLDRCVALHVA
jgi:hypothetical protein